MSKMIIIAGTIDLADPGERDEALAAVRILQQQTRAQEPGCVAYVLAADPCDAGRLVVHELWRDEASLAAHFQHENFRRMRETLGRFRLKGADARKYRVELSEPVYDPSFTPRADFFTEGRAQ